MYKIRYKAEIGALQLLGILSSEAVVRSFGAKEASAELDEVGMEWIVESPAFGPDPTFPAFRDCLIRL